MGRKWSPEIFSSWPEYLRVIFAIFILLIPLLEAVEDIGSVECGTTLEKVIEIQKTDCDEISLLCPRSCHIATCRVTGSDPYTDTSSVCCAAIHKGVLQTGSTSSKSSVTLQISRNPRHLFFGSTKNGIKSRQYLRSTFLWFKFQEDVTNSSVTSSTSIQLTTTQPFSNTVIINNSTSTVSITTDDVAASTSSRQVETTTYAKRVYDSTTYISTTPIKQVNLGLMDSTSTNASSLPNSEKHHILGLKSSHELVILLIGVFICGVLFTLLVTCIIKKKKKRQQRTNEGCTGRKQKNITQRFEEDVCVCYQSLNSSKQGLLYDPETCERPCPIRKPTNTEDSILHANSLMFGKSFDSVAKSCCSNNEAHNEVSRNTTLNKSFKRNSKCIEIAYEDECAAGCSGACNPQQYDF